MADYTIDSVGTGSRHALFADRVDTFRVAGMTLEDGSHLSLSQYPSESPDWGVDSYIKANGMPVWVHSAGERTCNVSAVSTEAAAALNARCEVQA